MHRRFLTSAWRWLRARGLCLRRSTPAGAAPAEIGRAGERAAARYLRSRGFRVLARNAHAGGVEIDLVCLGPDGRTIVVVEVKSRHAAPGSAPTPEASIGARKRARLVRAASAIVRLNGWENRPIRIDVIAIQWHPGSRTPVVRHLAGAVGAER